MKIKRHILFLILLLPLSLFAQQDMLLAYPRNISYRGDIAYYNGSPFTGILADEKTNKRLGEFRNGYRNGIFTEYFTNVKKKSEGKYIFGVKDGTHTEWHENGKKKSEYNYSSSKIVDGKYISYLENGQIDKEETFKDGQKIYEGIYKDGVLNDVSELVIENYPIGRKKSEVQMKNGMKTAQWTSWYENGQMESSGKFLNDKKNGKWEFWKENGNLESSGNYINDIQEGEFLSDKEGKLIKYFFINGEIDKCYYSTIENYDKSSNSILLRSPNGNFLEIIFSNIDFNDSYNYEFKNKLMEFFKAYNYKEIINYSDYSQEKILQKFWISNLKIDFIQGTSFSSLSRKDETAYAPTIGYHYRYLDCADNIIDDRKWNTQWVVFWTKEEGFNDMCSDFLMGIKFKKLTGLGVFNEHLKAIQNIK